MYVHRMVAVAWLLGRMSVMKKKYTSHDFIIFMYLFPFFCLPFPFSLNSPPAPPRLVHSPHAHAHAQKTDPGGEKNVMFPLRRTVGRAGRQPTSSVCGQVARPCSSPAPIARLPACMPSTRVLDTVIRDTPTPFLLNSSYSYSYYQSIYVQYTHNTYTLTTTRTHAGGRTNGWSVQSNDRTATHLFLSHCRRAHAS